VTPPRRYATTLPGTTRTAPLPEGGSRGIGEVGVLSGERRWTTSSLRGAPVQVITLPFPFRVIGEVPAIRAVSTALRAGLLVPGQGFGSLSRLSTS
jgi:hypothetical protein